LGKKNSPNWNSFNLICKSVMCVKKHTTHLEIIIKNILSTQFKNVTKLRHSFKMNGSNYGTRSQYWFFFFIFIIRIYFFIFYFRKYFWAQPLHWLKLLTWSLIQCTSFSPFFFPLSTNPGIHATSPSYIYESLSNHVQSSRQAADLIIQSTCRSWTLRAN
jgi:hypothetical protein